MRLSSLPGKSFWAPRLRDAGRRVQARRAPAAMTVSQALAEGRRLFASAPLANIGSPALDAALLLGEVLGKSRADLIVCGDAPLSDAQRDQFLAFVSRRRGGECVAYILGRKEFRGLEFAVNPHVLVPRPDTETLVEAALEYVDFFSAARRGCREISLLDLCAGSGALAVSLKNERPSLHVAASDISPEALETAALNAARLLKDKAITCILSDLFADISGAFDIIVSNPPYIPTGELSYLPPEVRREPRLALDGGEDGLDLVRNIVARAGEYLSPGGVLLLEASPEQMPAIKALFSACGFGGVKLRKDLAGRDRVVSGLLGDSGCPQG